ncbi:MAG: ParB N-terminal domain-containing protein, partial [Candidatus Hydrogenedentales bacterium]
MAYPTQGLKPASYNPRAISEECLAVLQDSIRTLGFVKPVIVTTGNTLIAGHQRTKAASALGIEHVPAVILDGRVEIQDEIRFNQLHNGTDLDAIDQPVCITSHLGLGYSEVEPSAITVGGKARGATARSSIAQLVLKYGPWGCAVVSQDGEVLSSPQYALACKSLSIPCRVYVIENSLKAYAKEAFSRDYGRFSYDHIDRST